MRKTTCGKEVMSGGGVVSESNKLVKWYNLFLLFGY